MRLDFEPEVAVKPHSGTSKFPAADSATTGVGSSPFPEGEDAIPEVTHGPGRGRDGGSNRLSDDESVVDGVGNVSAEPGQGIYDAGRRGESGPITHGFVKVTILEARDYNPSGNDCKPYVILRYGDREYKTSHLPKSTDSECSWQCVVAQPCASSLSECARFLGMNNALSGSPLINRRSRPGCTTTIPLLGTNYWLLERLM